MAITKTASTTDVQTGTTLGGFSLSAATGTLMVVGISRVGGTVTSVTDDKGNTYIPIGTPLAQTNANIWLYYARIVTGGSVTPSVNLSATGTESVAIFCVFSGLDTSAPFDQTIGAIGSGAVSIGPTADTIQSDELVVSFIGPGTSGASPGTGYTLADVDGITIQAWMSYKVVAAQGAQTATWTGATQPWAGMVATFRGPRLTQPGNYGHYARVSDGMSRSEVAN